MHQMDEAYDALTDYHDRVEQFDPACEHTFSYLQVRCINGRMLLLNHMWMNATTQCG